MKTQAIGSGFVNTGYTNQDSGEPGVTPPPPDTAFLIDDQGRFLVDSDGNRLIGYVV